MRLKTSFGVPISALILLAVAGSTILEPAKADETKACSFAVHNPFSERERLVAVARAELEMSERQRLIAAARSSATASGHPKIPVRHGTKAGSTVKIYASQVANSDGQIVTGSLPRRGAKTASGYSVVHNPVSERQRLLTVARAAPEMSERHRLVAAARLPAAASDQPGMKPASASSAVHNPVGERQRLLAVARTAPEMSERQRLVAAARSLDMASGHPKIPVAVRDQSVPRQVSQPLARSGKTAAAKKRVKSRRQRLASSRRPRPPVRTTKKQPVLLGIPGEFLRNLGKIFF